MTRINPNAPSPSSPSNRGKGDFSRAALFAAERTTDFVTEKLSENGTNVQRAATRFEMNVTNKVPSRSTASKINRLAAKIVFGNQPCLAIAKRLPRV